MKEVNLDRDIAASLRRVVTWLSSLDKRSVETVVARVRGKPVIHTQMQALFNARFSHPLDRTLYEMVMLHATAAEKLGPGGFTRCVTLLLEKLTSLERSKPYVVSGAILPTVPTRLDLQRTIERHAGRGGAKLVAMLQQAVELTGFGGKIIIEKTSSTVPSVELVRGYTFDLKQLLPIDVSFVRPRIVCIDGYVESVSEVHHLLEGAAEAKEPCMLFLRGMADEVKHTLKVNYDRGSLRVVPISVQFDLEGMNTLADISVVSGCDLISSLKGDLISSVQFTALSKVDQCTAFRGRVVITNTVTHRAVNDHVSQLKKRREEEHVDDVARLLDKRIRSLSPNHVILRLPDNKDFVTHSQAVDYSLRAVRSMIDHGVTSDGDPVATELAAQTYAQRCFVSLANLGAVIYPGACSDPAPQPASS